MQKETLEMIGLSQEELQNRVVEQIVRSFTGDYIGPSFGDDDVWNETQIGQKIRKQFNEIVDAQVEAICSEHLEKKIEDLILATVFQKTNQWGERQGEPMTFKEYLADYAENWLTEKLDRNGKPTSYEGGEARITQLIGQHIDYHLTRQLKIALKDWHKVFGEEVGKLVKAQVNKLADRVRVEIKT